MIEGHAVDLDDLNTRLVVELWLDGWPARLARADRFDAALFEEGLGDGCYGFRFVLDSDLARSGSLIEARLANTGELVGELLLLEKPAAFGPRVAEVRWAGGLRFTGWMGGAATPEAPSVRAIVDGEVVAEARVDRWTYVIDGPDSVPARAFRIDLPNHFADGRARRVRILDEAGRELPGSPVAFLAFEDGLQRFCLAHSEVEAEQARGAIFDAIFARGHPMRDFGNWRQRFPTQAPRLERRARALVALYGVSDPGPSLKSLSKQQDCDWAAGILTAAKTLEFAPSDLAALIAEDAADADFVVFAPAGAQFAPHALALFAESFEACPEALIVYGDLTFRSGQEEWPIAFTAFDYERMLEQGYAALCFAARRPVVEAAVEANLSDPFALFLSTLRKDPKTVGAVVAHTPEFVWRAPDLDLDAAAETLRRAVDAHLAQRSVVATSEIMFGARFPAVRVMRKPEEGKVSVIVATRESPESLHQFIETLGSSTRDVKTELIVVDMESASDAALDALMKLEAAEVRIARMIGPAQRERAFNTASNIATGEYLVFCTDDMRPSRSGWLNEMLGRLSESRVGAVTPTLLWPTGVVQQCGLVLGPEFSAARAFQDVPDGDLGYAEMLATAHEVAAAGAAGLLVRRADFLNFNGFDTQRFGLNWAAIDFSLRLRAAGLRIIGTPYAKLKRLRVDRRLTTDGPDSGDRAQRELEYLRVIWGDTIANDDLYHPFLSQSGAPYSALAWPPRPSRPRMNAPPRPHKWPDGI